MIQTAKNEIFGHFLEFGLLDLLDITYFDSSNVFQHSTTLQDHEGSFKCHKNAFLNDPKSQKDVLGHFLEFGLLDRLDIAYCDSTKCFPILGNVTRS